MKVRCTKPYEFSILIDTTSFESQPYIYQKNLYIKTSLSLSYYLTNIKAQKTLNPFIERVINS